MSTPIYIFALVVCSSFLFVLLVLLSIFSLLASFSFLVCLFNELAGHWCI